jgi:molybdopterin converting factor small subunit
MARIVLTRALAQQTDGTLEHVVAPGDVRSALDQLFDRYPRLRRYLLNDQSHLLEHISIFVNDELVGERVQLENTVGDGDTVFVLQAVSGGAARTRGAGTRRSRTYASQDDGERWRELLDHHAPVAAVRVSEIVD